MAALPAQGPAEKKLDAILTIEARLSETSHLPFKHTKKNDETVLQCIRNRPMVLIWCVYAIWVMVASAFTNSASSSILGIPQFRKDFGKPFAGNYVLPAKWQSAYYGSTGAA